MTELPITRNNFIRRILTAWAAICSLPVIYAIIQYIVPPSKASADPVALPAGRLSEYGRGAVKLIRQGKSAIFVRETGTGQLKAFSGKCTHLGCLVEFLEEEQKFRCNCHGSLFDPDGKNISGPAVRPLQPYRVEVRGDDVFVTVL